MNTAESEQTHFTLMWFTSCEQHCCSSGLWQDCHIHQKHQIHSFLILIGKACLAKCQRAKAFLEFNCSPISMGTYVLEQLHMCWFNTVFKTCLRICGCKLATSSIGQDWILNPFILVESGISHHHSHNEARNSPPG